MPDASPPPAPGPGLPPPAPPGVAVPDHGLVLRPGVLTDSGRRTEPTSVAAIAAIVPRAGELTLAWRVAVVVAWVGVFVGFMAVWKASEEIGLATWWLGPRSNPQPMVIRLVPFVIAATCGAIASFRVRHVPLVGMIGAAALAMIAVPDFSLVRGLALVELAIAGAVALVCAAAFTGRYQPPTERVRG